MPERAVIDQFLAQRHLAFVGVSRQPKEFANSVYRHLRDGGRTMYPVNAHVEPGSFIEGDRAFVMLGDVPDPVDGVVIMPRPDLMGLAEEAVARGIPRVWIHRGAGQPPVPVEVTTYLVDRGVQVVDGACPLMFDGEVHGVHRLHRALSGRRIATS